MSWNIAEAKQRFSEVVRRAAEEPQVIYNRGRPVAAVIGTETLASLEACRKQARPRTLAEEMAELRRIAAEENYEPDFCCPRVDRPNAFVAMLDEIEEAERSAAP